MRSFIAWNFICFMAVALSGCSSSGSASLTFSNLTVLREELTLNPNKLLRAAAPTVFQMKLIAAYITEDIDGSGNNTGTTSLVYLNPDCEDDIQHCDISAGTAEDGAAMSKIVTSYFDFAAGSTTVNAALNAQSRDIEPTSYKYARLEFCKYNTGSANNIKWADGTTIASGSPQEFKRNSCSVNSAVFSPAITVSSGGSIAITLSYDLGSSVTTGSGCTGDDSSGSGVGKVCFTMPTFTPSAS